MKQADVALDPLAGCAPAITFDLPWPGPDLSPNARIHHMAHYRAKKQFKDECFYATKTARVALAGADYSLTLVFYPPTPRRRDRDNLLASMKAGLDGMAKALGVDDSIFDPVSVSLPAFVAGRKASVRVILTPREAA
jgi:crossover junction endodeoxyribonuclease RusA